MFLKFIVIAVNENVFIVLSNKIKISTLIIVDIHSMDNTKIKGKKPLQTVPKQTARTHLKTLFHGILALTDFGYFFKEKERRIKEKEKRKILSQIFI